MSDPQILNSNSPQETVSIAKTLGQGLRQRLRQRLREGLRQRLGKSGHQRKIVLLFGELGAGKTLFTRGICQGLGLKEIWEVDSPTYTLMNQYATQPPLIHFDLYRIQSEDELDSLSFYEIMESDELKIIEWPERLSHYRFPQDGISVQIEKTGKNHRKITLSYFERDL